MPRNAAASLLYLFLILSVIFSATPPSVAAEQWHFITQNSSGRWYYDSSSLSRTDNRLEVWVMFQRKDNSDKVRSIVAHEFINPGNNSYLEEDVYLYDSNGKLVAAFNNHSMGWRSPATGSLWSTVIYTIVREN